MSKYVNLWIKTKMTKSKKEGFYNTNLCPMCHAESLTQTNACHSCGTMLKGYETPQACRTCKHGSCSFLCDSCTNKTGNECKCDLVSDVCPFYEGDN